MLRDDLLFLNLYVCQCEADGYGHSAEDKRHYRGIQKSPKGAFAANLQDKWLFSYTFITKIGCSSSEKEVVCTY